MKKNKNRKQREDITIFNINQFEEEEDENDFMQIQLSSKVININVFQLFKHSQFIRENYQKNTIKQEISNYIQQLRTKYNMKDESISLFFKMIQEGNAEFNSDYYYDLYKLSQFFKIKSIQKFLKKYSKSHSKNLDFIINIILTEKKEEIENDDDKFDRIENLSIEMETYLSDNINQCFKKETFEKLPISTIFRIIEKSDKNSISDESLLDFIIKSIDDRIVLFSFFDIKKLPKDKIDNLFKILTESHYLNYLPFNLEYVKSLINSNEETKTELESLKKENNKLKSENKKLENQKNQLKKENEKFENKINELNEENENLENKINELNEENENLENKINELNEKNKNLEVLENQISNLKEENENRKNQIDLNKKYRSKLSIETQKNKTLQKQMDNINEENNELKDQIDKLKQENENLENQLKNLLEKREVTNDKKIKKEINPQPFKKKEKNSSDDDEFDISDIISRNVGGDKHQIISFDDVFKPKRASHEFININFIFDNDLNGKKFYPIKENINLDSTIAEIQEMISKKCNIAKDELIVLKRKVDYTKLLLFPSQKVRDIIENIKEKNALGKVLYIIYVEIQPIDLITNAKPESMMLSLSD